VRFHLKEATAAAHRELDAQFAAFDLNSIAGYRRFLEASAAALWPLESALERGGVADLLDDWVKRSRRAAIAADIGHLGGAIRPLPQVDPMNRNQMLGTLYVLEGSRLGAKFLLRTLGAGASFAMLCATAYLSHGAGEPLWPSFLACLEREPVTSDDVAEVTGGAREAFAMFARAAARA
jgi:heme oxygenase